MSDNIRTFIALPVDNIDSNNVFEKPEQYQIVKTLSNDSMCVVEINQIDQIQNHDLLQNKLLSLNFGDSQNINLNDGFKDAIEVKKKTSSVYKCPKCKEVFNKISLYHKHMMWHRNYKKYKCSKCSAGYNVETNFLLHMAIHGEGKPVCPICKITFQRLASLKSHLMLHQVEELYTCEECAEEFEKEDDLFKHLQNHVVNNNSENNLTCSYCNVQFDDEKLYKEHVSHHIKVKKMVLSGRKSRKVHTNKEYPHVCSVCLKSFSRVSLLERHLRVHSGERPFICPHCNRGFNQKGTLQIHLSKHTGLKPFQCTLCSARFNQKGNLRVHVEKTHTAPVPGVKMYKCSHCTCIFKKIASLNVHVTKFHAAPEDNISNVMSRLKELEEQTSSNKMEQKALIGTKKSNDASPPSSLDTSYVKLAESFLDGTVRQYLVMQKRINHVRFYICTYCNKEFKKPSDLIRHTRVHTREKPFVCKQCGASFALKSTLFCHVKTHSSNNTYLCSICKKKFSSIRSLNAHLRKHAKKNIKEYKCVTCNETFNSLTKATQHSDEVHNNHPKSDSLNQQFYQTNDGLLISSNALSKKKIENIKQFQCQICNLKFTKMSNLNRHLLIHGGERKFKCNHCLKSYFTAQTLKEHLLCHSGVKKYSCTTCGKKYMTSSLLKRHTLTHNTHKPYVCPYCCKNFQSATLCKRHLNIHKKEIDALAAGELQNSGNDNAIKISETSVTNLNELQQCNDNKGPSSIFIKNITLNNQEIEDNNPIIETSHISDVQGKMLQQLNPVVDKYMDRDLNAVHTIFIDCNDVNFSNNLNIQNSETGFFTTAFDMPEGSVFNVESFNDSINLHNDEIYNNQVFNTPNTNQNITEDEILKSSNQAASKSKPKSTTSENIIESFYTHSELNLFNVDSDLGSNNCNLTADDNLNLSVVGINEEEISTTLHQSQESSDVKKNALNGVKLHHCTFCSKGFKKQSDLIRHIRTHTGEKPFGCDKCDKKFSLKSTLLSHQRTHNPISHKHYNCIVCNSFFTSKSSLKVHMSVHTGDKAHDCNFCPMKFRTAAHRKSHETNHHMNPTKTKKQKITNLLASVALGATDQQSSIGSYNDDKAVANKELENILIVEDQLSFTEGQLGETNNIITLTETNNKLVEPIIIQQFPSNLLVTDDSIMPSIIYLNDEAVLADMQAVKNDNEGGGGSKKPRNLECEHCGKKYASKDVLRRHKKSHGINKKFPCNKCDKGFDLKEEWEKHEKTHIGFRPYSCIYCSNSFSKEHCLTTHMKRIHNISVKNDNNYLLTRDLS